MVNTERSRPFGYTLLWLNRASACGFLIVTIGSILALLAVLLGGGDEPEGLLGWALLSFVGFALFRLAWATSHALARRVAGDEGRHARPAVYGSIVLSMVMLGVGYGVSIGAGGLLIGILLVTPFVGFLGGAFYLW